MAGVETIDHGDAGTPEIFKLMKERNVALCPTLAAGDATSQYAGWIKGEGPEPPNITRKRASFKMALDAGVTIVNGSDVGVFAHGDNARELELMVEAGLTPEQALRCATAGAASLPGLQDRGLLREGRRAYLVVLDGDPLGDVRQTRRIRAVWQKGREVAGPVA